MTTDQLRSALVAAENLVELLESDADCYGKPEFRSAEKIVVRLERKLRLAERRDAAQVTT